MNAFTATARKSFAANLLVTPTLQVAHAEGATLEILGIAPDDLIKRHLDEILDEPASLAIAQSIAIGRRGGMRDQSMVDLPTLNASVTAVPVVLGDARNTQITIARTLSEIEWQDGFQDIENQQHQHDRDGFLDLAAKSMSDRAETSVTMVKVFGGLNDDADDRMRHIVHQEALKRGATATSRLDQGTYGILHSSDAPSETMFDAISNTAVEQGLVEKPDDLGAEEVVGDGKTVDPATIRATLADTSTTLASRIGSGFRRLGLGRRVDDTKRRVAELMVDVRKAIKDGAFLVETRPILSLRQNRVAIHEVRAHPVINGFPVETSVIEALGEDTRFARDMQLASVDVGLRHHHDLLVWQGTSLRVMVSMMTDMFHDKKARARINGSLHDSGASPRKLILRACRDSNNGVAGDGETYLEAAASAEWRVAVPDFYAFVKAETTIMPGDVVEENVEAKAYIEVDVSRLKSLCDQKDGRFLVKSLIATWRGRRTEIVATSVNATEQMSFVREIGVRYAKGNRIGDWRSAA